MENVSDHGNHYRAMVWVYLVCVSGLIMLVPNLAYSEPGSESGSDRRETQYSAVRNNPAFTPSKNKFDEPAYARSYRPWGDSRTRAVPVGTQRSWEQLGKGPVLMPRFRYDESIEQALRKRNQPQQNPRYRPLKAEEFAAMNGLQTPQQDPRFRPLSPPLSTKPSVASQQNNNRRGFGMPTPRDYSSLPYANQTRGQTGVGMSADNPLSANPLPGRLGSGLYGAGLFPAPATPISPWSYPGPWPIPGFY